MKIRRGVGDATEDSDAEDAARDAVERPASSSSGGVTRGRGSSPRFARRRRRRRPHPVPGGPSRASREERASLRLREGEEASRIRRSEAALKNDLVYAEERLGHALLEIQRLGGEARRVTRCRMRAARARRPAAVTCPPPRKTARSDDAGYAGQASLEQENPGRWLRMSDFATTSRLTRWSVGGKPRRARTQAGARCRPGQGRGAATGAARRARDRGARQGTSRRNPGAGAHRRDEEVSRRRGQGI